MATTSSYVVSDKESFLTVYPLLSNALSVATLLAYIWHHRRSRNHDYRNHKGKADATHSTAARPWLSSSLFEFGLIIYGWMLVYSSCSFVKDGSLDYSACVGIMSWTWLLALHCIAAFDDSMTGDLAKHAWTQAFLLYTFHWTITAMLFCNILLETGIPSFRSPMSQGLLVLSLLLGQKLLDPVLLVATVGVQDTGNLVEVRASVLSLLSFSWLDALVWRGFCKRLEMADVWGLTESDTCSVVAQVTRRKDASTTLLWQLIFATRSHLVIQSLWALIACLTSYGPTLAMQSILSQIESHSATNSSGSHVWQSLCTMLLAGVIYAVADAQTLWQGDKIKLRLRSIVVSEIYQKILQRPASGHFDPTASGQRVDDGTITNLATSDADKIAEAGSKAYEIWVSVPVRVGFALYLLYQLLGLSSLAGILIMLAITPVNSMLAGHMGTAVTRTMSATDARVQETDRLLRNLRMIKLFAWEDLFKRKLSDKRSTELRTLRDRQTWWEIMATLWYVVPSLITFAAFFTFTTIQQKPLQPSVAFTALSLFGLLKAPLDQLVGMSARIQESLLSVKRIENLLQMPGPTAQRQPKSGNHGIEDKPETWGFSQATLACSLHTSANSSNQTPLSTLKDINLTFASQQLHILAGPTGSGKTSLLMALLGEMIAQNGKVSGPRERVSYCAQEAWLSNDTIKANILFGAAYDKLRYDATVRACALVADVASMKAGDATMVGEQGASLSGGQKQRVALARAMYAKTSYVLLDDCLSAVDSNTAKWLVKECITGPLMEGRTCVLATHSIALLLPHAASVTVLANGTVAVTGSPAQLSTSPALRSLTNIDDHAKNLNEAALHQSEQHGRPATVDTSNVQGSVRPEVPAPDVSVPKKDIPAELVDRPPGNIPLPVIWTYLSAMGGSLFWFSITFLFAAQQLTNIMVNWWLGKFVNAYSSSHIDNSHFNATGTPSTTQDAASNSRDAQLNLWYYLGTYATILVLYSVVNFARLYAASVGSLAASDSFHMRLLTSVLQAKFQFLDRTSHGTLLKSFTQDISTVDNSVMPMALGTIHFLVLSLFIIAMIGITAPASLLPGVAVMVLYLFIGRMFLDTARQLETLKGLQQEPVQQHISETLLGAVSIRAFRSEARFASIVHDKLDEANRPALFLGAVDRWLTFRLNVFGTLLSFAAGYFALSNVESISPGGIGLILTYTMTFSENIMWMVRYHALNQQNFIAVERINNIANTEPETSGKVLQSAPEEWPVHGSVKFNEFTASYANNLPPALRGLTFEIRAGERIGIVGRTGAGKSSLSMALLRALGPTQGSIYVDGIDIREVGLHDLRNAVCLIPQDPSLLTGSLRENLDPFGQATDEEILQALSDVGLGTDAALHKSEGEGSTEKTFADLSMQIQDSGTNLSLGQRQLFCMARALLRKSKIVVLDEATASIDHATDALIQSCLARLQATIITIAHRLATIMDYDKVLVLDHGEVRQFDHPWILFQAEGEFRKLCAQHGNVQNLGAVARAAYKKLNAEA